MKNSAGISRRAQVSPLLAAVLCAAFGLGAPAPLRAADLEAQWDKERLNVVGVAPLPGQALSNSILFFFDGRISVPDGGADPFAIEPALPGRFQTGPNFIQFNAAKEPEHQVYRVTLSADIRTSEGRTLNPRQREWVFAPFVFGPTKVGLLERAPGRMNLGLEFSAPVDLNSLKAHLAVRQGDGAPLPVQVSQVRGEGMFRLALRGKPRWPIRIVVSKGLTDKSGALSLQEDRVFIYAEGASLTVENVVWGRVLAEKQEIALTFSEGVNAEDLKRHLTIRDKTQGAEAGYDLATSGLAREHRILLHLKDLANVRLSVEIAEGLAASGGVFLAEPFSRELVRTAQPLRVVQTYFSSEGEQGLALNFQLNRPVSVEELKAHLEFAPPLPNLRVKPESDNSFFVFGDWNSKQTYEMKIAAGLKDREGAQLDKPVVRRLQTETVPPYLGFSHPGKFYLPRRAGSVLSLQSRNVSKAEIRAYRMFPSNIAVALSDMDQGKGSVNFNKSWAEEIAKKELDLAHPRDRMGSAPVDLESLLPKDRKGLFCLEAAEAGPPSEEEEDWGARDTKLVLLTEIGLLAHWRDEELVLFAHDLFSLAPLPGATVSVYSAKNQLLGKGETDAQGFVQLGNFTAALGAPAVAVVERQNDYSFLELTPREEDARELDLQMPPYDAKRYEAFLYADRELYRPGETVHLHWIVRQNYGDVVANVPLLIKVLKPNGRSLLSQPTTLSALGSGGLDVSTQEAYPTGRYVARLFVPEGKEPIGEYAFYLEEFVPNRIKAAVRINQDRLAADEECEIVVNGQQLFGAPAAGRKCEAELIFERAGLATKNWKEYRFENDSEFKPGSVSCGEGRTDEEGNAAFRFTYRPPAEATFPLKAVVVGRVFELGGRAVAARTETTAFPSAICLGVGASASADGRGVEVFAAAIRPDETPAALERVKIALEKQIWNYYVRRYYDYNQANWSESFQTVETKEIELKDGKGSAAFSVPDYGYYRVRVFSDQTPQYSTLSFYSYGGRCEIVQAARPSLIKLTLDKESYEIGQEAHVRVESPFDGKGIVALQGESIQKIVPLDIQNNVGEATFKIEAAQFPNVWVEATVIHALEENKSQVYPFSSFAMAPLTVRDRRKQLQITFPSLPKEVRPAGAHELQIEARDAEGKPVEAELTVAAVDEGIHSMTDYQSPDPCQWLCRSRRPDLRRAHYYDKIAYDFEKPAPGGDGVEGEMGKRISPPDETWIRTVALWAENVKTGPDGRATVALDIPEFTGQLRLAAVAWTDKAAGARSENLFVRRPHMLRTSMPRFLYPGDTFRSRAVLFNQSAAACKARLSWSAGGALLESAGSKEIELPAGGEGRFSVDLAAGQSIGQGQIRWEAVYLDAEGKELERLAELAPIPVRAPAAYETRVELAALKPGESRTFRLAGVLDDERAEMELTAGANPLLRLQKALEYVADYPYGCVEQTTSRLMPLYLLRKNADLVEASLKEAGPIEDSIETGISRLLAMQTASGGLAFWPGGPTPHPYGSVYALHFLTLAKNDREFDVPEPSLKALQDYVRQLALDWTDSSPSALFLRAYAVYVLALNGDLDAIQQIERFDTLAVPQPARFLLAAALAHATRDVDRVKLYLAKAPSQPYDVREPDQTLSSDIRNRAVELLCLLQIGGQEEEAAKRAGQLVSFLESRHHGTTQETAFVVTALSQYLCGLSANIDEASAAIVGPDREEKEIRGRAIYEASHAGKGGEFTVSNTGKADIFVNLTTRGIPEHADASPKSEGVGVRRAFYSAAGEPCSGSVFQHADSYFVELAIDCEAAVKNLIVTDLLPAGFEIENPRLDPKARFEAAAAGAVVPSHLELRDDRLVLAFDGLDEGPHTYQYAVRAVTPGAFQHPPVRAECMYDAAIYGQSAPSPIEVREER